MPGEIDASATNRELLERISRLEAESAAQRTEVQQLQEAVRETDANLRQLIAGVDRLVAEMERRPAAVAPQPTAPDTPQVTPSIIPARARNKQEVPKPSKRATSTILLLCTAVVIGGGIIAERGLRRHAGSNGMSAMDEARIAEGRKEYARAETLYRDLLAKDPQNEEVIRHLASVLFREGKWDQSAAVLKTAVPVNRPR